MHNLFHEVNTLQEKPEKCFGLYKFLPLIKNGFFFAPPDSSNRYQCFKSLNQDGQKRNLFIWLLTFIPPAFAQTFLKIRSPPPSQFSLELYFANPFHLDIKSACTYLPADNQLNWTSQGTYKQFFLMSLCYHTCLYHFLPGTKLPASRKTS
jgi:hypothetical protein